MCKKMFLIIFVMTCFLSCKKHKREPINEDYLIVRSLSFYLKDSLGNNLIGKTPGKYNPDSIRIFCDYATGKTILDSTGNYYSGIVYLITMATKEEDINSFYIDLPVYVYLNQSDTDTLEIKKDFNQTIRFYYNGEFIDSIAALDKNIPVLNIRK